MQTDEEQTQPVKEGAQDQNAVRPWHRPGSKGSIGAASENQKEEVAMQYDPAAFSTTGSSLASTVNTDGQGGESSIDPSVQSDGDD